MLGMPILSGPAGFIPSTVIFIVAWLFMMTTGLLLLEVNLWFKEEVNIVSMAEKTLGRWGKRMAWGLFLFLFYSLMIAYVAGTQALIADFFGVIDIPEKMHGIGLISVIFLFGLLIYEGTAVVDRFNRTLMTGLVTSYLLLLILGFFHVDPKLLLHQNWEKTPAVLPVLVLMFGFHNLIPSLKNYLQGNATDLKKVIFYGSLFPLVLYVFWQAVILGIIPPEGENGFIAAANQGNLPTTALRNVVGYAWIYHMAELFAFFAIVTSFLSVALSLVDFLADGLHMEKTRRGRIFLCLLALVPPYLFALYNPKIFILALKYAGGFGAVILFGIMPALMVWKGRYLYPRSKTAGQIELVPGGKAALVAILAFSALVFLLQLKQELAL